MRLLHVALTGVKPFKNKTLDLDFFAEKPVKPYGPKSGVIRLGPKNSAVYSQNVVCFTGVNATGKTTALQALFFVLDALTGTTSLGVLSSCDDSLMLRAIFEAQDKFYLLESELQRSVNAGENADGSDDGAFEFVRESLYQFHGQRFPTKAQLKDFLLFKGKAILVKQRETGGQNGGKQSDRHTYLTAEAMSYLSPFSSIALPFATQRNGAQMGAAQRGERQLNAYMSYSPNPFMRISSIAGPILHVFDDSVEYFQVDEERKTHIRFVNEESEHVLGQNAVQGLLSSGTQRGSRMISMAIRVLKTGGYFLIDEIENSMNKELVRVIINLFVARKTNPYGATLVFTTHYPELLDLVNRTDNIYIFRRSQDRDDQVETVKYSSKVKRGELKRSEVFISNYIGGTAPKAANLKAVRDYVAQQVRGDSNAEQDK
ncbi:ATP-binding protein [Bifidobacterium sp. ESL0745]|uniref:ATP-binding protein n=1 Tax=Bifidobacterium sp. ESL0745 TaxID=2983226 RepID=UPI0023F8D6A8|nr:ATP-binding protein [Bifidobacterium sp. ESL0745]MDF7664662.1 ATP-binding protein [Bifidobacterium sp. ESL0745]